MGRDPIPPDAPFDPRALPPYPAERAVSRIRWLHVLDDVLGLCAAYALTYLVRFGLDLDPLYHFVGRPLGDAELALARYPVFYVQNAWWYLLCFGAFLLFVHAVLGLYDGHLRLRHTPLVWNLLLSNGALFLLVAAALYFRKNSWHMRGFLPLVLILNVPCTYLARRLTNAWIASMRRRGRLIQRTLLVGAGRDADEIERWSDEGSMKGYRVVDRVPAPRTAAAARELLADRLAANPGIAAVFVVDADIPPAALAALLDAARRANRACVVQSARFLRLHNPFHFGDTLRGIPLVHYAAPGSAYAPSRLRDPASRALAAALLVPAAPVMLLCALAIRLETPGPALFVQERYGLGNRKFRMLKFRTMVADAESRLAALRSRNETDGALFKLHDHPRVTRVGHFLRRTSLDELPQLVNIARGEMRFVGPRPLPCEDIEPYLSSWQGFRQTVPPGLTCIWQVSGRSDVGFEAMAMLDNWYALNRSWVLDIRILARTLWSVVFGAGAY